MSLSRRTLLWQAAAATGTTLLARVAGAGPWGAAEPRPGVPSSPTAAPLEPDIYAFTLGGADAYVVHDGAITFPGVQTVIAPEAPADAVTRLLREAYLPTDHVAVSLNVLVVRLPSGPLLVDAGGGAALGPTAGRLTRGLQRLGIAPGDVRSVVVTHAHGDHVAGLLGGDGTPAFPNARVFVAAEEAAFWATAVERQDWTGSRVPPAGRAQSTETARKFLNGVGDRLQRVAPGGALVPGVTFVPTPGHTPGHQAVRLTVGGETLLHVGDAVHQAALQFPHPEWSMAFDTRPAQASATRRALLARLAAERTRVLAYHLPFPGIGHVRASGDGYAWVPQPWVV